MFHVCTRGQTVYMMCVSDNNRPFIPIVVVSSDGSVTVTVAYIYCTSFSIK